jgi:hypothetical protein
MFFGPMMLSFVGALLPICIRAMQGKSPVGTTPLENALFIFDVLPRFLFFWLTMYYAEMAAIDANHRLRVVNYLRQMVSADGFDLDPSKLKEFKSSWARESSSREEHLLQLDLRQAENVEGWGLLWRLMGGQRLAPGYSVKFQYYGVINMSTVLAVAYFNSLAVQLDGFGISSPPAVEYRIHGMLATSTVSLFLVAQIVLSYLLGDREEHLLLEIYNERFAVQAEIAACNRNQREAYSSNGTQQQQDALGLLEVLSEQMPTEARIHPVRVLFLKAEPAVVTSLVTVLTFIFYFDLKDIAGNSFSLPGAPV